MLYTYADKEFRSASDSDLGLETEEEKEEAKKQTEENKPLLDFLEDYLEGKVSAVRLSQKLKSHPVCLSSDGPLSIEMEKMPQNSLPAAEEKVKAERVLEINAGHPVFGKLQARTPTHPNRPG